MTEDAAQRSKTMRAVKSKDTTPELIVRKLLHKNGYRYRLHRKELVGKPDVVFPARKKLIFVHGCFWHGHHCKRGKRMPKNNAEYWHKKITRNVERFEAQKIRLSIQGWRILVIWECEIKDKDALLKTCKHFLDGK